MKTGGFLVIHTNLSSAHICRHGQWTTKLLLFSNSLHFHPSISRSNKYSQVFSLTLSWIFICSRKSSLKKSRFFKHFCFCVPCLTVGAVPLLKLLRKRESVNLKVLYFVGSDQKCGTKFSACCAHWWQKKRKNNSSSLVVRYFLLKKIHVRLKN